MFASCTSRDHKPDRIPCSENSDSSDSDYGCRSHPRSDSYLLMGNPTMAAFRPHDQQTSAALRFPADHFGILLILTAPGEQPRTLPMRTAFLFHHRLSPIMAATCDYTFSANKNQRYEIVKLSSITLCSPCHTKIESTAFVYPKAQHFETRRVP